MTGPMVVECASCAGLTFTLDTCRCVNGGGQFVVEADQPDRRPYGDCLLCHGFGTVAHPCRDCGQHGNRRAQLVLTVVNADTGAVASINLVPGGLAPHPAPGGRWQVALTPLVRELAATVDVHPDTCRDLAGRPPEADSILLPREWQPDLPAERRLALEAESLAGRTSDPWRVYLGRSVAPPAPDLDRMLGHLCQLADLIHLDLVVEARHHPYGGLSWGIRYELPGAPVPAQLHGYADELRTAVANTTIQDALYGLADRSHDAPAHHIRPETAPNRQPDPVSVDQLERRIMWDCAARAGAQAIWRDCRWWHTSLRIGGITETLAELVTGQVTRQLTTALHRSWEPPAPAWLGEPIPYVDCPDCRPGDRLRACLCTYGDRPADPTCASCDGVGVRPWHLPCFTCAGSRRVYQEAAITVTDLAGKVIHDRWQLKPIDAPLVGTQPGGKPIVQLPDRYRLARLAARTGSGSLDDLTWLDGGQPVGQDLRDGTVTLNHADTANPLTEQIALATRGQPGGRLLITTAPPDAPPLAELIRIVLGLHLAVTITVQDHRLDPTDPLRTRGCRWDIEVTTVDLPAALVDPPHQSSLAAAIANCLTYLELALADTVPTDPAEPIPVPQTPTLSAAHHPVAPDTDNPAALLTQLAHRYPDHPLSARFAPTGCTIHLHADSTPTLLTQAPTLATAARHLTG